MNQNNEKAHNTVQITTRLNHYSLNIWKEIIFKKEFLNRLDLIWGQDRSDTLFLLNPFSSTEKTKPTQKGN